MKNNFLKVIQRSIAALWLSIIGFFILCVLIANPEALIALLCIVGFASAFLLSVWAAETISEWKEEYKK
jgi:predicted RND superfamily exporter protein